MRRHRLGIASALAICLAIGLQKLAQAAVLYTTPGSTYSQDFNSLPTDAPNNANLETVYTDGWQDDVDPAASAENDVSLPGWYLYHPIDPADPAEDGFNGNQRFRMGNGGSATGSFYAFAAGGAEDPEKALGGLSSTVIAGNNASMFTALRLTNNTGITLNEFTLTFDGEQWRDGAASSGMPEVLSFDYSTTATPDDWFDLPIGFKAVPALNFTAPVNFADAMVDGNIEGRVDNITATVTGVGWAPDTDLWLRWTDISVPGADDGIAIDDVSFSAVAGSSAPTFISSAMSGPAGMGSTWSNNQPPVAGEDYHVLSGHTVAVSAPFDGGELRATSGGAIELTASAVHIPLLIVDEGGSITENVSGDFALGDINAPMLGTLQTNEHLTFDMDAGSDFFLDVKLLGTGDLNFNSNGAGSELFLSAAQDHDGTIRFNGTGDGVHIVESESFNILEMNSTGANTIVYNPREEIGAGTLVFNQPGTIDHASTTASPLRRLHGANEIVANAPITVDLTKGFPDNSSQAEERRWLVGNGGIHGTADITVNGTTVDYSNGTNITHNEFEVGSTGEPTTISVSTHSGTITSNNYVNFEIRRHFPNARFVINDHGRLEMGNQAIASSHSIQIGEVAINEGGTLEVGFEQQSAAGDAGHHAYRLTLTSEGTRDGNLTLADGATVRMQINGTATGEYDQIMADGNVQLNGMLNVLVNPSASTGMNPTWTPSIGQTLDIINIAAVSPGGDYDGNGTVGNEDYDLWRANFGTANAATDGNGDGVVDSADYVVWRDNAGDTGGTVGMISGTFDSLVVTDALGSMTGLAFQVNYSPTRVQLEVVAAGASSTTNVPEPSTSFLLTCIATVCAISRKGAKRHRR
jgi:hypothetical protein